MDEPIKPQQLDAPKEVTRHPWGIWLWLAPVIAVSLTPVLVVVLAGIGAFGGVQMPDGAWQIAGMAFGVLSGILVGVGASQAVDRG